MTTATVEVHRLLTAECGLGVEKRLRKLPGVRDASVNPAAGSATADYDERAVTLEAIKAAVRDCGYGCTGRQFPRHVCKPDDDPPPSGGAHAAKDEMAHEMGHGAGVDMAGMVRDMRNRFLVCLAFTLPLFLWAPMRLPLPMPAVPFGLELAALAPGTRTELMIARAGKQSSVAVELGRRPAPQRKAAISRRPY